MTVLALNLFDDRRGIVATDSGTDCSTDGGGTRTPAGRRTGINPLSSLFFLDARRGWASCRPRRRAPYGGIRGDWTALTPEGVDTSYRSPVRAIQFQDGVTAGSAGNQASLMRTADGGVDVGACSRLQSRPVNAPISGTSSFVDQSGRHAWSVRKARFSRPGTAGRMDASKHGTQGRAIDAEN